MDIYVKEFICTSLHSDDDVAIKMYVYKVKPVSINQIKLNAHTEYKWININEINNYNWPPVDIYVLKFLK